MAIRFIYFDLGKVLLNFTHERGFAQIAEVSGAAEPNVRSLLVDSGLSDRYETGDVTTAEFHQQFCDATGTSPTIEELSTAWGNIFELIPSTVTLATNLKSAGYSIGILSNTCEAHWEYAANRFRILQSLFEPVITSYEARSMKPDAVIYQRAAEAAGVAAEELFFVDDRQENVDGATQQGWNARLFTGALQLAGDLEELGLAFNR